MSRSLSPAHLDETTLLRLVVADLDATEHAAAERHLQQCAPCRWEMSRTERLDAAMRETAANAARPADAPGVLPSNDSFRRRPQASHRLAKEAGLDVRSLAEAAAEASIASATRTSALLKAVKGDKAALDAALASVRFDSLADRLALSGALSEAFDRIEDDAAAYRRLAEAALDRISAEPAVEGLSEMRPKPEEYAAPLARLAAEAQLLLAACELLHAEFDAAGEWLEAAWRSLDGGRNALPLVARMETIASILRTVSGRPAEGLALAERAAETFAVTGHPVDAARAEFAKGLAELAARSTREGNVSLRRARGAFARAGAWGAFALTVTALSVAETGRSDGPELKGLFRASLGRLRRADALDAFQFLRATHRVVLLTRREPKWGKGTGTAKKPAEPHRFEPSMPYLMRGGDLLADGIVSAARESDEALGACLRSFNGQSALGFVLQFSCQKGSVFVGENPPFALKLADSIVRLVRTTTDSASSKKTFDSLAKRIALAEAYLLESQAQNQLFRSRQARLAAVNAGEQFRASGNPILGQALTAYYVGSAALFLRDSKTSLGRLSRARSVFKALDAQNLFGRSTAMLGTHWMQVGDDRRSVSYMAKALDTLDPWVDAMFIAATLVNLAVALRRMRRFNEARAGLVSALRIARRLRLASHTLLIRHGLADLDRRLGRHDRALSAFRSLWRDCEALGHENEATSVGLFVAECLGRLGRERQMAEVIRVLRARGLDSGDPSLLAVEELLASLDEGDLKSDELAIVRRYLESEESDRFRAQSWTRQVG